MSPTDVVKLVKEKAVKFCDLRFTDTRGKEQHVTVPARYLTPDFFVEGKMYDGSSIGGWKGINESDMILLPDATTAVLDPFFADATDVDRGVGEERVKNGRGGIGQQNHVRLVDALPAADR